MNRSVIKTTCFYQTANLKFVCRVLMQRAYKKRFTHNTRCREQESIEQKQEPRTTINREIR